MPSLRFSQMQQAGVHTVVTTRAWGSINPFVGYAYLDRLAAGLGEDPATLGRLLVFPEQVHGVQVHPCVRSDGGSIRLQADGVIATVPGLRLCVYTADCLPILLAAPSRARYGILHAGWRGLLDGILPAAIAHFCEDGTAPTQLLAGIGPGIHGCCYEVQEDLAAQVRAQGFGHHLTKTADRMTLDLVGIAVETLISGGLVRDHIEVMNVCTACRTDLLFSARRRHDGEERGSSIGSLIWMLGEGR
jgi:YfiH family protein